MNNYTVYMHISPSNKRYVGITCQNPKYRWRKGKNYKNNKYFTNAIEKYGWDNFEHIIVAKGLSKEEAEWLEIELIKELDLRNQDKGYNITKGGEGHSGHNPLDSMTEEAKKERSRKLSDAFRGVNPLEGKTEKELKEIKEKISKAGIGRTPWNKGKTGVYSEETLKKFRSRTGEKSSNYGKHFTDEHKQKIGKANKKPVICLTYGSKRIFSSLDDASSKYQVNTSNISMCCKGKRKSAGKLPDGTKLVWRYVKWNHNKILRPIGNKIKR